MLSNVKALVKEMPYLRMDRLLKSKIRQTKMKLRNKVSTEIQLLILENPYVTGKFFPLRGTAADYIVPLSSTPPMPSDDDLPLPPVELW